MLRCGLLGETLGHSYSPMIHHELGEYDYRLFEVPKADLDAFLCSDRWDGLNVTIPYKKAVVSCCGELSEAAERLQSVNTLVRRPDGTLYGDNTDLFGFLYMVRSSGIDPAGKKALVLGSGGASVTVKAALEQLGADVTVISRSGPDDYDHLDRHADAQIIANTTPVGMYPDTEEIPIDVSVFPNLCGAVDAIYNPLRTSFVLKAGETSTAAGGLYMLVAQAAAAAELFTGRSIPQKKIEHAYKTVLRQKENIVLIGMPTAGKSTVGRIIAEKLGKSFFDSDELAAALEGKSIPGIFAEGGENAFRKIEHRAIALLSKQRGAVIATGGGAVLREENMAALRKNGRLYYLERPLEALSADENHPLSQTAEQLAVLFTARKPLYEKYCDTKITVTGGAEETAAAVLEDFLK